MKVTLKNVINIIFTINHLKNILNELILIENDLNPMNFN